MQGVIAGIWENGDGIRDRIAGWVLNDGLWQIRAEFNKLLLPLNNIVGSKGVEGGGKKPSVFEFQAQEKTRKLPAFFPVFSHFFSSCFDFYSSPIEKST